MTALQSDWPFLLVGWPLMLAGVFLVCRALFHDRPRGCRRCPACWYSMDGVPNLTCPECGRTARADRALLRTRRRWKHAVLAAAAVGLGLFITRVPDYNRRGWYSAVPSSVLIFIAPADYQTTAAIPGGWQQFANVPGIRITPPGFVPTPNLPSAAGGTPLAPGPAWSGIGFAAQPPPARTTTDARDEIWNRLQSGRLARWQSQIFLARYFRTSPLDAEVRLPERWIVGEPIPVIASDPIRGLGTRLRVRGTDDWGSVGRGTFLIGSAETARDNLPIDIQLYLGPSYKPHILFGTSDQVTLDIRPDRASLLDRRDDPEANKFVRRTMQPYLERTDGPVHLRVSDTAATDGAEFLIAFRAAVEIDGEPIGRTAGELALIDVWKDWLDLPITWEPGGETRARAAPGRLQLVIQGDPETAASIFMSRPFALDPVCWAGTIRIEGLQLPP